MIDIQLLKSLMLDNQREVEKREVKPRNIKYGDFDCFVLVGIRRAGKSYMLYQKMQERLKSGKGWDSMLYINFEDERLDSFESGDFNLILEAHEEMYGVRPALFLDEIQNIKGWEKFARRLADSKYEVWITGSNANMLSQEIQTTLGARYMSIDVYPYSFKEFLSVSGIPYDELSLLTTERRAAVKRAFDDYLHNGGFPESILKIAKRDYVQGVYQKILLGDIAARNKIVNIFGLRMMIKKFAESVKQPMSFNRLSNLISATGFKLSITSAINYTENASDAWLITPISNVVAKMAEKESYKKYYFADNGLLNLFILNQDTSLLENMIAINLIRRYGREDAVFYCKKNEEVDFYVPEDQIAIQSCYSLKDADTYKRELTALNKICSLLPCKVRYIITFDEERTETDNYGEIKIIPAWKWLLE